MPFWKPDNTPIGTSIASILYGLQQGEDSDLIFEPICLQDARLFAQNWGGEFLSEAVQMDGIVIPASRLDRTAVSIMRVFNASVAEGAPECTGYETDQFKKNGITSVVIVFAFTDGQAVTIFFNNPDLNPNMIAPTDTLVSWKVLLQRMDITIAVAPERGKELPIRTIAARVMKLVAKNSAAFLKRNATAAERMAAQAAVNDQVNGLNAQLEAKAKVIEELNLSVVTKTGEFQAAAKERDDLKVFLAALPEPPAQSQNITATGADGEYIYSFDGGMVRLQAPVGDFGQFELSVQYADKPIKTYSRLSTIDMPSILDQAGVIDIGYSKSKKKNAPPVIHTIDRKGLTFVSGKSDFLGNVLTNALPSIQYVGIDSYMDFAPFTDVNIVSAGSENVYFVKNEGNEYRVEYVTKLLNPRDFTEGQNIDLWAYVQENHADDVNSSADYRFDALKDALVNGFAWVREGDNLSRDDDKCKLSLSKDGFGVSLVDVTNAATVAIFDLPASFYKWVAQDKATEIESKIVEYERDLPAKSDISGASLDDIAGKYPPVENSGSGYYTAYKNDKKIDSWLARFDGRQWYVSANNASTRAYNNGMGKPKFFATIEDMIKTYPAFAGLPALLAAEAAENPPAAPRYDKIYDAIGSILESRFGWKGETRQYDKEKGNFFMITMQNEDRIELQVGQVDDPVNTSKDVGSVQMVAPNGGDELLNIAKQINDKFEELTMLITPTAHLSDQVIDLLVSAYGWSKDPHGNGVAKSFPNMAQAGELSDGSRTLPASFDSTARYLAVTDNAASTGGKIIAATEIDLREYNNDATAAAKSFNARVNRYVENEQMLANPASDADAVDRKALSLIDALIADGWSSTSSDANAPLAKGDATVMIVNNADDTDFDVTVGINNILVGTVESGMSKGVGQIVAAITGYMTGEKNPLARPKQMNRELESKIDDLDKALRDIEFFGDNQSWFMDNLGADTSPLSNGDFNVNIKVNDAGDDFGLRVWNTLIGGEQTVLDCFGKTTEEIVAAVVGFMEYSKENNPRKYDVPKGLSQREFFVLLITAGYKAAFRKEWAERDGGVKEDEYVALIAGLNEKQVYLKRSALTEKGSDVVASYLPSGVNDYASAKARYLGEILKGQSESESVAKAAPSSKKSPDLTYREADGFTVFVPETDAGKEAWNEMANDTDGTGKVLTIHAKSTIAQLRAAGYVVEKSKNTASMDDILSDDLLSQLDATDDLAWLTAAESNPASLLDTAKLAEFQAAATIDPRIKDDPAVSARFSAVMDAVTKEMMKAMQAKMSS